MIDHKKVTAFLVAVGMAAIVILTGCGAEKKAAIDTTDGVTEILDYVTVEFDGKNGEGTAFVNVDYNGLETEMVGGEENVKDLDEMEDLASLTKYINAVSSINLSIDKNSGLANGDQVTVSVSFDHTAAEAAGVVFGDTSSKVFEVKGLKR